MKTPTKVTTEEALRQLREYMKDNTLETEIGGNGRPSYPGAWCIHCGTLIVKKDVHISIHALEFGDACAGWGEVKMLAIPFCPQCEPEPEDGCIHMPYSGSRGKYGSC